MAFIGNTPQNQSFAPAIDYFSGNGVTVTFTLSRPVASVAQVIVAIDNVIQNPSSAFTVSGNSITFTSAPLSGTNNIWVEYTSLITTYAAISQDPSVIGDITATGGFLAEGDFGNSYIDGTIVDYVTGNARITTGPIDDMTFYHGGTSGRSEMMRLSYAGNSYIIGNFGVGTTSPVNNANQTSLTVNGTSFGRVDLYSGGSSRAYWYAGASGTALGAVGANYVAFDTNSTERMRIDSSGNVGIGTTSPSAKLQVNGDNIRLQGDNSFYSVASTAGSRYGYLQGTSSGLILTADGATYLRFDTNSSERMRIDSSGRITTPYQPAFHAYCNGTGTTSGSKLLFQTVSVNVGSNYNSSTSTFTAPVAGTYYFYGSVMANTGTGRLFWRMYKNGSFFQTMQAGGDSTNYGEWYGSAVVTLAAGDYMHLELGVGTPYATNQQEQYFGGYLLG